MHQYLITGMYNPNFGAEFLVISTDEFRAKKIVQKEKLFFKVFVKLLPIKLASESTEKVILLGKLEDYTLRGRMEDLEAFELKKATLEQTDFWRRL